MAGGTEFDNGKFKELILLLVELSAGDPLMSRVKLNKLLYYVDFETYRRLGRSMTGAIYIHGEHGPMAADLPRAEEELGNSGYLSYRTDESGPHPQKIPIAHEKADRTQFTAEDQRIVADALLELKELGGWGAREWSHDNSAGWNLTGEEEPIPYETAFIAPRPISDKLLARARSYAVEEGWIGRP